MEPKSSHQNKADVPFWDWYWDQNGAPHSVDLQFSFDRCLAKHFEKYEQLFRDKKVFEIGCCPGKWLRFFSQRFNADVGGIDNSTQGISLTKSTFDRVGINSDKLIAGDFFETSPQPVYDVVVSLGFIEHFENPVDVIQRHAQWLKPDGHLFIGVPNFAGLHGQVQAILDTKILDIHNLNVMKKSFFLEASQKVGAEVVGIEYLGSFEPALPVVPDTSSILKTKVPRGVMRIARTIRDFPIFDGFNNSWISSYLVAVLAINKKSSH